MLVPVMEALGTLQPGRRSLYERSSKGQSSGPMERMMGWTEEGREGGR